MSCPVSPSENESEIAQLRAELDLIFHVQVNTFVKLFSAIKQLNDSADASKRIDQVLQTAIEQYAETTLALTKLSKQIADREHNAQ